MLARLFYEGDEDLVVLVDHGGCTHRDGCAFRNHIGRLALAVEPAQPALGLARPGIAGSPLIEDEHLGHAGWDLVGVVGHVDHRC